MSPGALSKAVSDLEAEMGQRLFVRSRAGFTVTEAGAFVREKAEAVLALEEEMRERLQRGPATRRLVVFGTEPLVALYFAGVLGVVGERFPDVLLEVRVTRDDEATRTALAEAPTSLALVSDVSRAEPSRSFPGAPFGTFVGVHHELASRASRGVPVAEVLTRAFVVPDREVFGPMQEGVSADGWRDDVFPRKIRIGASTLAVVSAYVETGHAIGYMPVALGERLRARRLKVTGCPYSCTCTGHLLRSGGAPGWMRQIV